MLKEAKTKENQIVVQPASPIVIKNRGDRGATFSYTISLSVGLFKMRWLTDVAYPLSPIQ